MPVFASRRWPRSCSGRSAPAGRRHRAARLAVHGRHHPAPPDRGDRRGGARGRGRARRRPFRPGRRRRSARWSSCPVWWSPPTSSAPASGTAGPTSAPSSTGPPGPSGSGTSRPGWPPPPSGPGIARELHDIVAHSLTVVVDPGRGGDGGRGLRPPGRAAAMGQVATTGRAALAEMRRLLGVLRTEPTTTRGRARARAGAGRGGRAGGRRPGRRAAGAAHRRRPARPLAAAMDATAHRIVQESLTNVLKHAVEPSAVEVLRALGEDELCCRSPTTAGRPRPRASRARADRDAGAAGPVRRRALGRAPAGRRLAGPRARCPSRGDRVTHPGPAGRRPGAAAHRLPDDPAGPARPRGGRRGGRRRRRRASGRGAAARRRADGRAHAGDGRRPGDRRDHGGRQRPRGCSILTTFDLDEYAFAALRAGASGFLLKDVPPAELAGAIRAVAAGDAVVVTADHPAAAGPRLAAHARRGGAGRRRRRCWPRSPSASARFRRGGAGAEQRRDRRRGCTCPRRR